jgi:hypothetical protein
MSTYRVSAWYFHPDHPSIPNDDSLDREVRPSEAHGPAGEIIHVTQYILEGEIWSYSLYADVEADAVIPAIHAGDYLFQYVAASSDWLADTMSAHRLLEESA